MLRYIVLLIWKQIGRKQKRWQCQPLQPEVVTMKWIPLVLSFAALIAGGIMCSVGTFAHTPVIDANLAVGGAILFFGGWALSNQSLKYAFER